MLHVKVLLVGINSYFVKYSQRVEKMDADKINFHSPPFRFQEKSFHVNVTLVLQRLVLRETIFGSTLYYGMWWWVMVV